MKRASRTPRPLRWSRREEHLARLHEAALAAADPGTAVLRALRLTNGALRAGSYRIPIPPTSRIQLLAIGKASVGMARAAVARLGPRISAGLVIHPSGLPRGSGWPGAVRFRTGAHPVPDSRSLRAGAAALAFARRARPGDLLLVLLSGGGSALAEALGPGLRLSDLRAVTRDLQRSGADITALNTVRRALSALKGGGLLRAAAPARVVTLALSDVAGDRPEAIASGPTVPSPTGARDALEVISGSGLAGRHPEIERALRRRARARGILPNVPRPVFVVVGSNRRSASAVVREAGRLGFAAKRMGPALSGEARDEGRRVGRAARRVLEEGRPVPPPACLVFGGETTVTVRGRGKGGRNLELALEAARILDGVPRVAILSFATDGLDGSSGAAGAVVTGRTMARARRNGLSAELALSRNDTMPFFRALGDLRVTGPTGTNVNDLTLALVYSPSAPLRGSRGSPRRTRRARRRP